MIKFKTLVTTDFFEGAVLGLSRDQAYSRMHNLEKVRKGVYRVTSPVQFKSGEVLKLDDPDKVTQARLECLEPGKDAESQKTSGADAEAAE